MHRTARAHRHHIAAVGSPLAAGGVRVTGQESGPDPYGVVREGGVLELAQREQEALHLRKAEPESQRRAGRLPHGPDALARHRPEQRAPRPAEPARHGARQREHLRRVPARHPLAAAQAQPRHDRRNRDLPETVVTSRACLPPIPPYHHVGDATTVVRVYVRSPYVPGRRR